MKNAWLFAFAFATLLISACGDSNLPADPGNAVTQSGVHRITVQLFGAPWCQSCKEDLPAIDRGVTQNLGAARSFVTMQLWVTTGGKQTDPPTVDIAAAYAAFLKLDATPMVDKWVWQHYQTFFPERPFILPAVAVLDENGNAIKTYQAGRTSFVPQDIANFIATRVVTK